jgi:hypothetical protein
LEGAVASIPIILFAYARPEHLCQTLHSLRANRVPRIYAFSDAPATPDKVPSVAKVRDVLQAIDWCDVVLCRRETNLGLGRSILAGVAEVLKEHEAAIIFEDDLICVPGTYEYLCAALDHYQLDNRVMSVTGWTHPLLTPSDVVDLPYFDGRAECWAWGTWARAWPGMDISALALMEACRSHGIDIYGYGADLVDMARAELRKNIWAVRLLYLHMLRKALCLRPPWSMVRHIGWDPQGTNAKDAGIWEAPPLRPRPPIPAQWPQPEAHPECGRLHQKHCGARPTVSGRLRHLARHLLRRVLRPHSPR